MPGITVRRNPLTNARRPNFAKSVADELFVGGGEMGALMRSFDWTKNPLGPIENWSPTLQATVRMLLSNCFPMLLWWGPDFYQLYNDAYIPVLGDKHPQSALAKPFRECWSEVFHILGPLAQTPFEGGPPTWMEDIPLELNRFEFTEEAHFTIGYSPVPDNTAPGGIGGVLAIVHEITQKVLGDRRVSALRDLSTRSFEAKTGEEACEIAASTLGHYPRDIPFALIYLTGGNGDSVRLASQTGADDHGTLCPELADLSKGSQSAWPLASAREQKQVVLVKDLEGKFGRVPQGPWSDPPQAAAVVPIKSSVAEQPVGFLVAGLSSRLRFDDSYRGFLELLSAQIATAISNSRAYEEERKRVEALAEIDRTKTAFFTNVSHEFRTPLTLMMGPIEDALIAPGDYLTVKRENLELAHRNSLRLLKLVNALLDFARIEAGRAQAVYEPVDLAEVTTELASVFRSVIESAGLKFIVNCRPLDRPVYVDREMWEKIVLNLLSNAFKFTLEGTIEIGLNLNGDFVELAVRDTGTGIPAEELPDIFKRFHRAKNVRGRNYEGSGIGLALVKQLAELNGGSVVVESAEGRGSVFTVSIPLGLAHLPADQIGGPRTSASTAISADAYVQEALRWIPDSEINAEFPAIVQAESSKPRSRIVLADDNADIRDYVGRLLSGTYEIESVADGQAAFQSALRSKPDLILTDVMMPKLDGFGLLRELRADERTASIPVLLISARAGEESRLEGIHAGADDYLVKPFSARELVARVESLLTLSRLRRENEVRLRGGEERLRALVSASSDSVYRMSPDWSEMRQLLGRNFIADTNEPTRNWLEKYIHPEDRARVLAVIRESVRTKDVFELEHRVMRADGSLGWTFSRAVPLFDEHGELTEWIGTARDITARKANEENSLRLATIVDSADDAIISKNLDGIIETWNEGAVRMFGYSAEEMVGESILRLIPSELQFEEDEILQKLRAGLRVDHFETRRMKKSGEIIDVSVTISPIKDASGKVRGASKIARDISDRKRIERLLLQSEKLAATGRMAAAIAHEINNPLESLINLIYLARKNASSSQVQGYLLTAEEELERVAHLARQTLGYYRDTGAPAELYLHDLIENVRTVYNSKLLGAGIAIDSRFDDSQQIVVSKGEMLQVFSNIIANSIDAMGAGGRLKISTRTLVRTSGDGIETVISDNGKGIAPENLPRIFEPFFTTKGELGTGIGLWVAKQLVEKRGGQISVASSTETGRSGTSTTIFIPFADSHSLVSPARDGEQSRI